MRNEEYLSYFDYLKSINFQEKLEKFKDKYANKKIILFGISILLDVILDNYNLNEYINVIGISDQRVTEANASSYKGFNIYTTRALRALDFDVILDTNLLFENTKNFLRRNYLVKKSVKIDKIVQISICEKTKNLFNKINALINYTITTGNVLRTIKYSFLCTGDEIVAKTNYIKKLRSIKKSTKPVKVAFICSDIINTEFMNLYNLFYFDKDYKLFPLILTPDNLLESDGIDEEKMTKNVDFFDSYNIKVIDGIDRDTGEIPALHLFKPDLIFYQKPIFIKDDYAPLKMSEQALTFTIEYFSEKSDFTAMGSQYYRKQVSHLWKIFVANSQDKNLYTKYTNTRYKDLVNAVSDSNINVGIAKYLKKCLKQH